MIHYYVHNVKLRPDMTGDNTSKEPLDTNEVEITIVIYNSSLIDKNKHSLLQL